MAFRLLLFLLLASAARGDAIDRGLLENGERLVAACKKRGFKQVGAVRFRTKIGNAAAGHVEPLSSNMADRVENLLIVCDRGEALSSVLRGVGDQASMRDEDASLATPAACQKVFAAPYTVAWGKGRARPDALLGGLVAFSPSLREAEVSIVSVTASGKRERLLSFKVAVDRSMLADVGLAFTVQMKGVEARSTASLERDAQEAARDGRRLVTVEEKRRDEDKILFYIKNRHAKRVGIVLRVAGRNAIGKEPDQATECTRLVIEAKSDLRLAGFLGRDGNKRQVFRVIKPRSGTLLSPPDSDRLARPQVDNLVEVAVFVEGEDPDGLDRLSLRGFGLNGRGEAGWRRSDLATELKVLAGLPTAKVMLRSVNRSDLAPTPTGYTKGAIRRARWVEYHRFLLSGTLK